MRYGQNTLTLVIFNTVMQFRTPKKSDLEQIKALLTKNGLPNQDIDAQCKNITIAQDDAPTAIKNTDQFSHSCAASATLMQKQL